MLRENELRIGNWVIMESEPFYIRMGEQIDDFADMMTGLPINHETLKAIGYKIVGLETKRGKSTFAYAFNEQFRVYGGNATPQLFTNSGLQRICECKHLHTLQNAVQLLTGEDINVSVEELSYALHLTTNK